MTVKTDPAGFGGGRRYPPYTQRGLARLLCSKAGCGRRASAGWSGCADGNITRPLCPECDVDLNYLVLLWWGDPDADVKIVAYANKVEADVGRKLDLPWLYREDEEVVGTWRGADLLDVQPGAPELERLAPRSS